MSHLLNDLAVEDHYAVLLKLDLSSVRGSLVEGVHRNKVCARGQHLNLTGLFQSHNAAFKQCPIHWLACQ